MMRHSLTAIIIGLGIAGMAMPQASVVKLPGENVAWDVKALERDFKVFRATYDADQKSVTFLLESKNGGPGAWKVQVLDEDGVSLCPFQQPIILQIDGFLVEAGQRTRATLFLPKEWDKARKVVIRGILD